MCKSISEQNRKYSALNITISVNVTPNNEEV